MDTLRGEPASRNATLERVLERMERSEGEREAALRDYTVVRRYVLSTQPSEDQAEMLVRMNYTAPGTKSFEVVWEKGAGFFQSRAFRTILNVEAEAASSEDVREQTRVNRENYTFRLLGTSELDHRPCYVIEITPKTKRRFQLRGRVWVDMEDFAIARLEGSPVGKTSWWLKKVYIRQDYKKVGRFWLPGSSHTDSDVRLIGAAQLSIEFRDYEVNRGPEQTRAAIAR